MSEYIYVLGMDGRPQMPTKRKRHVERLLSCGKARIAEHVPFTIQLLYENDPVLQPVVLAEDPGRTNIGLAAVSPKGDLLFLAVTETRNREIAKLMEKRQKARRASRNGERKARQRLAKRCHTMVKSGKLLRKLPLFGEEKYITCHYIRNTESRFCNRKREDGWLTPSAGHLVQTHLNLVCRIQKFLPVTDVALEVNRFAFMQLEDPSISGIDFQNGTLKGFADKEAAAYEQQQGKCLLCETKDIEQYHHIVPLARNGSDTLANLAGLCCSCHGKVHKEKEAAEALQEKKQGLNKKYGALSTLNQAMPFICKGMEESFGKEHVHYCTGRETASLRRFLGFHKTKDNQLHEVDAWCIGMTALHLAPEKAPDLSVLHKIMQFRRQNRANIQSQRARSYKYDGKTVAKNRKKSMGQTDDSLAEWFAKQVELHGEKEAERMRSQLTVKKSERRYNDKDRVLPGAVFLYQGERHVLSGQLSNGKYFRAVGDKKTNYPAKDCMVIRRNEGLVFIS